MSRFRRRSTRPWCCLRRQSSETENRRSSISRQEHRRSAGPLLSEPKKAAWSRSSAEFRIQIPSCCQLPIHAREPIMIQVEKLSKKYGRTGNTTVEALKEVTFAIAAGEFVSVRGASGSGKSTLLNILGCLDQPSSGSYRLDSEDVSHYTDKQLSRVRNAKVGFIFQSFNL